MEQKKKGKISVKGITNGRLIILSTVIFLLIFFFTDYDSSLRRKILIMRDVARSEELIRELQTKIDHDSTVIDGILHDDDYLIRFARENYYMIGRDEEIFLLRRSPEKKKE